MNDDMMKSFWWRTKRHPRTITKRSSPRSHSYEDHSFDCRTGMNFIAKHFFEYQSFINMPHKGIQLHKTVSNIRLLIVLIFQKDRLKHLEKLCSCDNQSINKW
uniref:Ovule protein n=1 Tax=Angiostrongylus cantonensis TaxID=6313 RepID=A0A0K0D7P1_ANGCA